MLYIVSTPIGNLEDITLRAIRIIRECDMVVVEDTRTSGILLSKYNIRNRMTSFNKFNEHRRIKHILNLLKKGLDIALISDSGTPGINDPAYLLVRECVSLGIKVVPVPGACSIIAALVCSGLPTDSFTFYGFVPKKGGKKQELMNRIRERKETAVMFESPHRLMSTLETLADVLPGHRIVVARELTKRFEEFIRGKPSEIIDQLKDKKPKGEYVMMIGQPQ